MAPIHELLNRIRWDPEFGRGTFELGYFDRVEGRVMIVPSREVAFPEDDPQAFRLVDTEGRSHRVPFHRVREVYKDGQRIWHRPQDTQNEKPFGVLTPGGLFTILAATSSVKYIWPANLW